MIRLQPWLKKWSRGFNGTQIFASSKSSASEASTAVEAEGVTDSAPKNNIFFEPKLKNRSKKIDLQHSPIPSTALSLAAPVSKELNLLSAILAVAGEEESIKSIQLFSVGQVCQVLHKMALLNERSIPVLEVAASKIRQTTQPLSLKQCENVLFSFSKLLYYDEGVLEKVCTDFISKVDACNADDVKHFLGHITAICRSLRKLRFRHIPTLEKLSDWIHNNITSFTPEQLVHILSMFALLNHTPKNIDDLLKDGLPLIRASKSPKVELDMVWSLALLDKVTSDLLAYILSKPFLDKILKTEGIQLSPPSTFKLLNIQAATGLTEKYEGPVMENFQGLASNRTVRSKEKQLLVNRIINAFATLVGETCIERDIDTGGGFLLDGECKLDDSSSPIPVKDKKKQSKTKVGILVLSYHDLCLGDGKVPNGLISFAERVLKSRGYKLLIFSHEEFNSSRTVIQDVQHIQQRFQDFLKTT